MAAKRLAPAAPTGAIAPNKAMAVFLFLPGGNVMPNRATAFGGMNPPPIPDRPRKTHRVIRFGANLVTGCQRSHHPHAAIRTLLWPKTAPRRPPISTNVPCVSGYDAAIQAALPVMLV